MKWPESMDTEQPAGSVFKEIGNVNGLKTATECFANHGILWDSKALYEQKEIFPVLCPQNKHVFDENVAFLASQKKKKSREFSFSNS